MPHVPPAALARPGRRPLAALALAATGATLLAGLPAAAAVPATPYERVVVTSTAAGVDAVARAVRAAGGVVLHRLPLVQGVSAELPAGAALAPSYAVVPDRPLSLTAAGPATPGPVSTVRQTLGLGAPRGEGAGSVVAVVDTGVADVPELSGRLTHVDVSGEGGGGRDGYGHGTFVAGLVASDGSTSAGAYAGVAPGAQVLDVRVAGPDGSTDLVRVLAGLQAVADTGGVDVVNLSLSSGSPLPHQLDPLALALDALWRSGTTVVVPSGNDGASGGRVGAPGNDPLLLTVGGLDEGGTATRRDDQVAPWSSRGPAAQGVRKPELVAPGASLVSLRAPGSVVDTTWPGSRVGEGHFRGSGTSFSTAVAAGAAAVLHAERSLTPDQVKALLIDTAYGAKGLKAAAGAGGLDLARAREERAPRADKARKANEAAPLEQVPGDPRQWADLLQALMDGDPAAAASSWAALPRDVQRWAGRSWSSLSPEARAWAGRAWADAPAGWVTTGRGGVSAEEWAAREWAARLWAGRTWAASSWAGRNWAASSWAGRNWADAEWATFNWAQLVELELDEADGSFPAVEWVGADWAGRNWAGRNWAGGGVDLAGRNWAGRNWAGRNWAGRNWAGRNWAGSDGGGDTGGGDTGSGSGAGLVDLDAGWSPLGWS